MQHQASLVGFNKKDSVDIINLSLFEGSNSTVKEAKGTGKL